MYEVDNIYIDLYKFQPVFNYETIDITVTAQFESFNQYTVIVQRIDRNVGWDINLNVFVWYYNKSSEIINVGKSDSYEKRIKVNTDFYIYPSLTTIINKKSYILQEPPSANPIPRTDFNKLFDANCVVLPEQLYAVGIIDGKVYMYNEKYSMFHEIIKSINHILRVYLTYRSEKNDKFYFIICAGDGYMEYHYPSERIIPRIIKEYEYDNREIIVLDNPGEYAVLNDKSEIILAQSYQYGTPNVIGIPDRHYFYCNLYHPFRSFHRGMSFKDKINKIVFAARKDRGTKYNFTNRKDIDMTQRQYFYSDVISKTNIECSSDWINNEDMVNYKYILDIDGMAATWDATAWKLNSGSVLFKTESCWRQWFYSDFLPWKNYIPVKDDFSDIDEKFEWCESNHEECQMIIENNLKLFQKVYRYQNIIDYTLGVIDRLNRIKLNINP